MPTDFYVEEEGTVGPDRTGEAARAASITHPIWSDICNSIRTEEETEAFRKLLEDHRQAQLSRKAEAETVVDPPGMLSLPSVQTSRKEDRIRRFGSPPPKGERRRR